MGGTPDEDAGVWRDGNGRIVRKSAPSAPEAGHAPTTQVYLATAHLDNNPGHNEPKNLKAFCQRCHIIHDRPEHLRRRRLNFLMTRALGDLFEGHYNVA